ncbi:uncharacterized protein LOC141532673 [Cotesia typhae]|uniref:uncharacterized protein LOC141532673 n=1 Tax=Cotesia typhae TaxID=2053667 RepID=UPI003D69213D
MGKCSVPFCKGKATFIFPKNEKRRILWEKAISVNFQSSKSSRLCSIHFEKDLIIEKREFLYRSHNIQEVLKKALFEEDSNNSSSSLPLSLLDDPINISENIANSLVESPIKNCISSVPSSSNENNEITELQKNRASNSVGIQVGRGPLSVQSISYRDDVIHYYTGLGNYAKFQFVYGTLSDYVDRIKYVKGQVNSVEPEDMFLLILMKLRRNIPDFGLSIYFGISEAVVRNIFNTWIHMIYQLWSLIDIWPSREVVDFYMPEGFKKLYPSTRVIVDATEIPIDKPSNPIAQQATFSTYKNKNTVKVLVGGSPNGILCYHSAAYGGSTSDRQIVERSDLVKKFQKGDSVMADRGFNVQDIFESQGVTVNIPHFLKGKQLPSVTVLSDRKLASKRVHIERLIGLTKTYKILREPLNPNYTRLATKIFSICLILCNLRESVVNSAA